jgi:hypothetical protein
MEFGILKSKIEKVLTESYTDKKKFKNNMFLFNELIAKNKNINKIFYLYDELSTNKGLNEDVASEFINQCQTIYENTVNKIKPQTIKELEMWVGHIKTVNEYENIDNLFSNDLLKLENKITSKKVILETIKTTSQTINEEVIDLPLKDVYNVANKTVDQFLENLTESEKSEVLKVLKEDDQKLEIEFNVIKESVIDRLTVLMEEENSEDVKNTITETINRVKSENYDKITYIKLKQLNRNI